MTGSSMRHGTHQAAHTLTTTGWPRRARTRACRPLRAPGSRSLACACSAASAGGAPSSLACSSCAEILLTFGSLGVLDSGAWLRPTTTITPRTIAPRIHGSQRRIRCTVSDPRTRQTHQAQSAVSSVLLTGRVAESREVPPVHRPRKTRGGSESPGIAARRDSPFSTDSQVMANSMWAAAGAAIPDQAAIERAEAFTRERFVHDGEDTAVALAPGSARRRALEDALREIDAGATVPSTKWRRRYALLLGLERVLSEDEPRLADGALLNPHQVDALSGTLTALLAAVQNGHGLAPPAAEPALAGDDDAQREPPPRAGGRGRAGDAGPEPEPPAAAAPDEEPEPELDEDEDDEDDDEPEIEG